MGLSLKKRLVMATAFIAVLALFSIFFLGSEAAKKNLAMEGVVVLGNPQAKMEFLVIEDFLCSSCRSFHSQVFSQINRTYIATGQARYILVPISVIHGSESLANAALAVYQQAPHSFIPFISQMFRYAIDDEIDPVALASKVDGIDLFQLRTCVAEDCNREKLEQNLRWARRKMGNRFALPALFINGKRASTGSFSEISRQVADEGHVHHFDQCEEIVSCEEAKEVQ